MSLQTRLNALITAIKTETKALRTMISGTNNGDVTGLNTTATNLVDAVNEVKVTADGAAGGGVTIDDVTPSGTTAYSGTKVEAEIAANRQALKDEILDGAAAEVDTLVEIAAQLAANTSTDAALAATVANKANSSDVYTQAELGDPETDLAALWAAA